ncbi:MAG: serine hydrolase, partial [Saprospiraceae bacterium]|nr:serine hydrolase [Pyrinomonadaceae bacterium]
MKSIFTLNRTGIFSITFSVFLICVYLCLSAVNSLSQGLPVAAPQTVGMSAAKLNGIDAIVNKDIADKKLPGAVVIVGHKGKIVYRKAFGNRSLVPTVEKMTVDTIFDVASLTKPIATATSIMILVEQGKLRLNDTIGKYITDIDDAEAKKVTIQQLLTHTSGYRPDFDLGEKWTGNDGMLTALKKEKLRNPPGTKFVYSDIGFIVLGEIVFRVMGDNQHEYFNANLRRALQITSTFIDPRHRNSVCFNCPPELVAPTENVKGQSSYLGSKYEGEERAGDVILRGGVHDPTAFRMYGVAGHAGLFSNADDLARYCQLLLNGGVVPDWSQHPAGRASKMLAAPVRILSAQTVAKMTSPIVVSEDGATRGLGWDMNTAFSSNRGELFPLGSFGHTGFTGTSVWIDRVSQTFVVFLSNRVHPDGKGDVTPLRAKVATIAASAVEDTPIEMYRLAENIYSSQVAAQIPKFKEQVERNAGFQPAIDTRAGCRRS